MLIGTAMAPMRLMPNTASTTSVRLRVSSSTRSPAFTPRRCKAAAKASMRSRVCRHVVTSPRNLKAVASGFISAWVATWFIQWLRRAAAGMALGI